MDIPKDDRNYPELCSDLATAQKRAVAERISRERALFAATASAASSATAGAT